MLDLTLGTLKVIANDKTLYFLDFIDSKHLEKNVNLLAKNTQSIIFPGRTPIICAIEKELRYYFEGKLTTFQTPFRHCGSPFQQAIWEHVQTILIGEARRWSTLSQYNILASFKVLVYESFL